MFSRISPEDINHRDKSIFLRDISKFFTTSELICIRKCKTAECMSKTALLFGSTRKNVKVHSLSDNQTSM